MPQNNEVYDSSYVEYRLYKINIAHISMVYQCNKLLRMLE